MPCDPVVATTSGAGLSAAELRVNASVLIDDWLPRFGTTFQEYRIRGVTFDINALDVCDGVTMFSISEDNFAVPSYDTITSATNWLVPNSSNNPKSHRVIRWKAIDLGNLDYLAIDNFESVASLVWYTDAATFNSPVDTKLFVIRPMAVIEFRGIGSIPT